MDAAKTARIANAITDAGKQDYPAFKETVTDLRTVHGDDAMSAAYERVSGSTSTPPADWK